MSGTAKARGTAPRGFGTGPAQLALYKVLYTADRPLTFAEICDRMAQSTHYQNDADRAYRESGIPQTKYLDRIKGNWDDELHRDAWEWWIEQLLQSARETNRISVTRADGKAVPPGGWGHVARADKVWSVNRDKKAPIVEVRPITIGGVVYKPAKSRVEWSPEQDNHVNRQLAERRFVEEAKAVLEGTKGKSVTVSRELLESGLEALG